MFRGISESAGLKIKRCVQAWEESLRGNRSGRREYPNPVKVSNHDDYASSLHAVTVDDVHGEDTFYVRDVVIDFPDGATIVHGLEDASSSSGSSSSDSQLLVGNPFGWDINAGMRVDLKWNANGWDKIDPVSGEITASYGPMHTAHQAPCWREGSSSSEE